MDLKIRFKMQSMILLVLIPVLLLVTVTMGVLIYSGLYGIIQDGFGKKLTAISTVTAGFINGDEHEKILATPNENAPMYLKYVLPMRRIKVKEDLTYLYTDIYGKTKDPTKNILYVLDASLGADHSNIGYEDTLPDSELHGVQRVQLKGDPYLSDIHDWQLWGLVKSGFAPIYDSKNQVTAMAGADVNVKIIQQKTRVALAKVGVVAVISLLIGGFVAIYIAGSLTRPIAEVKEVAIQVAAGQYGHRIGITEPWELSQLSDSFNKMSENLSGTIKELSEANRAQEHQRIQDDLNKILASPPGPQQVLNPQALACEWLGEKSICADSSGFVISPEGEQVLVWLTGLSDDSLGAIKTRHEISVIASRLLAQHARNWNALASQLAPFFTDSISCFVLLDAKSSKVSALARQSTPALLQEPTGETLEIDLRIKPTLALTPGQSFLIGSQNLSLSSLSELALDMDASQRLRALQKSESQSGKIGLIAALTRPGGQTS